MNPDSWGDDSILPIEGEGTRTMPAPVATGAMIGFYRIDGRLGEGGRGVVYKATDTKLNRPAARLCQADARE